MKNTTAGYGYETIYQQFRTFFLKDAFTQSIWQLLGNIGKIATRQVCI